MGFFLQQRVLGLLGSAAVHVVVLGVLWSIGLPQAELPEPVDVRTLRLVGEMVSVAPSSASQPPPWLQELEVLRQQAVPPPADAEAPADVLVHPDHARIGQRLFRRHEAVAVADVPPSPQTAPSPAQPVVPQPAAMPARATPSEAPRLEVPPDVVTRRADVVPAAALPSAAAPPQEVGVQGEDQLAVPRVVFNPLPAYPAAAQRAGLRGTVVLHIDVSAQGSVSAVRVAVSSGHAVLDAAALQAVRRWRFRPAQRDGQPAAMTVRYEVEFRP